MAYDVRLLTNLKLENRLYLFDSNLWIKTLKPPIGLSSIDETYLSYFKKFATSPVNPKIALPSLVLSEVINRLLREVGMQSYINKNASAKALYDQDAKGFYKKHYRPSPEFQDYYKELLEDITAFQDSYTLIDDGFNKRVFSEPILEKPLSKLDFNDNYYFNLAKADSMPIVTDDADFFVEGITVYTLNTKLYQKAKDSIKPIK